LRLFYCQVFSYIQFATISDLSNNYTVLKEEFEALKAENEQLLSWTPSTELAMTIIEEVIQIDISKYQATLASTSPTAETRADLGGIVEEEYIYNLVNIQSNFELRLRFRSGHFSQFVLTQLEGYPNYPPIYTQQQSTDVLQATKDIIQRYKAVTNDTYLDEVYSLLSTTTNTNEDQKFGNTKLRLSMYGSNARALIMYTENEVDFEAKCLSISFQNNTNKFIVTSFTDDWFLYKVGNTQINVSRDQAILAAKESIRDFSWTVNGQKISNFQIIDNQVSVVFYPKTRSEPLTLIPYWVVTLPLDQTYPEGTNSIVAGVWADTGEVVNIYTSTSR